MDNKKKTLALSGLGYFLCIAPPVVATLTFFPLWISTSSATTVSGLSMLLILVCIVPIFRLIKEHVKTPSAPLVWVAILIIAVMFRSIIDQLVIISFVGVVSSLAGFFIFKYRDTLQKTQEEKNKVAEMQQLIQMIKEQEKE